MIMTDTDRSSLSVILPNYNHGRFLGRQLEALATQSVAPLEILVIDDASTDDSLKVAEEAATRYSCIRILRNEQNAGTLKSVARGLNEAQGAFLLFAAADDCVLPGLIEKSLALLGRHPDAGVCTALVREIDEAGKDLGIRASLRALEAPGYIPPETALKKLYLHDAWFQCYTGVYRRAVFDDLGGFDPGLESFADSFLCTVMALRGGVCFIPEPLASVRIFTDSYSMAMTSNVTRVLRMFGHARDLMENAYADLFPSDLVDLWDRRWRYTISSNLVRAGETDRAKLETLMPRAGMLDKFVLRLLMSLGPARKRLVPLYLLFRLTPGDLVSTLRRRLFHRGPASAGGNRGV